MRIKILELERLVLDKLALFYSEEEARLITDVVLFGELSGKPSHGISRLLKENYGAFVEGTRGVPQLVHKTKVSTVIDGEGNPGMLVGSLAMQEVIRLAKVSGLGIVGTKRSINSTGSLSYYCEKIAKENFIAIIFTHCEPMLAPFHSKKALFGTNPLAFGIPNEPEPLIFDMSTAAMTFGSIAKYKSTQRDLPEHVAIDKAGNPTINPDEALKGAILAFDNSYKGSGLSMMVEILAGLWTGASFAGNEADEQWGNLYMAFSPELLSDIDQFKQRVSKLLQTVKTTPTREGIPMRIPGEHSFQLRDKHLAQGEIEVDEEVLQRIRALH
jgi:L-2-hydroxycarboxylate dehydrogenase (NAD+)